MEYQYIVNPQTNRRCRTDTALGKRIIRNYIKQSGGGLFVSAHQVRPPTGTPIEMAAMEAVKAIKARDSKDGAKFMAWKREDGTLARGYFKKNGKLYNKHYNNSTKDTWNDEVNILWRDQITKGVRKNCKGCGYTVEQIFDMSEEEMAKMYREYVNKYADINIDDPIPQTYIMIVAKEY